MVFHAKTESTVSPSHVDQTTLFKALSHPLRYRMMMILGEREASPKELSDILEEPFYKVYENMRRLLEWDLVELVDTDTRRGGIQHFYRARALPILDTDDWHLIPAFAQGVIRRSILAAIFEDIQESIAAGVFEAKPSSVLVRKPVQLDDRGMEEVDEASVRHLRAIEEAEANSLARKVNDGRDETFRATCLVASFQAAPPSP